MEKIPKFNKRRAFNKVVGPTFIPDYRVPLKTSKP